MDHIGKELRQPPARLAREALARAFANRCAPALLVTLSLASPAALAAGGEQPSSSAESLASSLARLRGEVDALSDEIETHKADQRARLRSLAAQQAELEIQLKREQLRTGQLAKRRAEQRARVEQLDQRKQALRPVVAELAGLLERTVARTLPFRLQERQQEPRRLRQRFAQRTIDVEAAVAQLWAMVEDELRLGRENGIYNQTLVLDGREHMVEVARVGMVMLFFRTRDGRYGLLRRQSAGTYEPLLLQAKEPVQQVARLFDGFKKQIRTGFFVLPNALGTSTSGDAR